MATFPAHDAGGGEPICASAEIVSGRCGDIAIGADTNSIQLDLSQSIRFGRVVGIVRDGVSCGDRRNISCWRSFRRQRQQLSAWCWMGGHATSVASTPSAECGTRCLPFAISIYARGERVVDRFFGRRVKTIAFFAAFDKIAIPEPATKLRDPTTLPPRRWVLRIQSTAQPRNHSDLAVRFLAR